MIFLPSCLPSVVPLCPSLGALCVSVVPPSVNRDTKLKHRGAEGTENSKRLATRRMKLFARPANMNRLHRGYARIYRLTPVVLIRAYPRFLRSVRQHDNLQSAKRNLRIALQIFGRVQN